MRVNDKLTYDRLIQLLNYDSTTGNFCWIAKSSPACNNVKLGMPITTISPDGYIKIVIDGVSYKAHRLAWLFTYGEFPKQIIDHVNQNKTDNRISNLREVSYTGNALNTKKISNAKGYYWYKKTNKWKSQININGKRVSLGYFDTENEAKEVYKKALMHKKGKEFL